MSPFQCQACGTVVPYDEPIPRDSECEGCQRDLRCCRNCRHYDVSRNNSCRETEADLVEDKDRRNFCEFFSFNRRSFVAGQGTSPRAAEARAKLESLFGGKPVEPQAGGRVTPGRAPAAPGGPSSDARRRLEGLFDPPKPTEDDE